MHGRLQGGYMSKPHTLDKAMVRRVAQPILHRRTEPPPHLVPCKVLNSLPCANSCVRLCLYAITNANTKTHASL